MLQCRATQCRAYCITTHSNWTMKAEAVWIYLCNSFCFLSPVINLHTSNAVTFWQQRSTASRTLTDSCNTVSSFHHQLSAITISSYWLHHWRRIVNKKWFLRGSDSTMKAEAVWIYLCNSFCFLSPVISLHTSNAVTFCQQRSTASITDSCNTVSSVHHQLSAITISSYWLHHWRRIVNKKWFLRGSDSTRVD